MCVGAISLLTLKRSDYVELIAVGMLVTQPDQRAIAAVQKPRVRAFHAVGKE